MSSTVDERVQFLVGELGNGDQMSQVGTAGGGKGSFEHGGRITWGLSNDCATGSGKRVVLDVYLYI